MPQGPSGQYSVDEWDATASVMDDGVPGVSTDEINNNHINLTRLVEKGPYTDILDAIANEPPNHRTGTTFVVEPGEYGPIPDGTSYTITWSGYRIVCPSVSQRRQTQLLGSRDHAAEIIVSDNHTGAPLQIGDANSQQRDIQIEGIWMHPESDNGGTHAIEIVAGNSTTTFNLSFRNCAWHQFGNRAININASQTNDVFETNWLGCVWRSNTGTSQLGAQAEVRDCHVISNETRGEFETGKKSIVMGGSGTTNTDGSACFTVSTQCFVVVGNYESSTTNDTCIRVEGASNLRKPTYLFGTLDQFDSGVVVTQGPVIGSIHDASPGTYVWDLVGGANDHDGTQIWYNGAPSEVNFANAQQRCNVIFPVEQSNVGANTLPPGGVAYDVNRGGTGTDALVRTFSNGDDVYWDADGTL